MLLPLFVSSCSDFLEVEDESAINSSIWDNETSAELYVNNIYSSCLVSFGGESLTSSSLANLSDETSDMSSALLLGQLTTYQVTTYSSGTYEVIRYINIALKAMQTSILTTDEKNRILGQLYFFRAWQHWKMINLYGGVPYMRDYVTFLTPDSLNNAPRNTTSECIKYLVADLDSAISKLPAAWVSTEYARITRAAAASFKGRVLLFYASPQFNPDNKLDRWQVAYDANLAARNLCLSDGYSLMSIATSVTTQWPYGYDFNQIFMKKKSDGNTEVLISTPYYTDVKVHGYENSVCPNELTSSTSTPSWCPTWDLAIAFPMKDGSLAFKYSSTVKNTRTFIGNNGDITKFYLNRDPRFYATIAFNGGYYQLEGNASRRQWNFSCPKKVGSVTTTYYSENTTSDKVTPTGFYCRKMVNPALLRANFAKSTTDWITMRYAEVLLNLAECAFETGNTETGYDCLKQIRARAGIDAGTDGYYGLKSSSDISPIELVMNERRIELAFEGKRFYDLRRRNMFSSDLGSYIFSLNGWKKSGSGYTFTLKNVSDTAIFLYSAKRDTIQVDNLYKYFVMTAKSTGPLIKSIAYICVPDSATLRTTTSGNYNFFDIPQDILTRSPAIEQTIGWQNGTFNPFN